MVLNTVSNLKFKDFLESKTIQMKQGDITPIAVKLERAPSILKNEKATVYLSNKKDVVMYKGEFEVYKGVVAFVINTILPVGYYSIQINYLGKKYPSKDSYYIMINPSADIAPEDIKDLDTIEMIEDLILQSVNSKIHEQVSHSLQYEVATYIDNNIEILKGEKGKDGIDGINGKNLKFEDLTPEQKAELKGSKGDKGDSFKYTDFTQEQLDSLKGKNGIDGTDGINGVDGKSAYQIAIDNGYSGDEQQWLESLKGTDGKNGVDGRDGTSFTFDDLTEEQKEALSGKDGKDGVDGESVVIAGVETDSEENTIVTFSDGISIAIPKGIDGINGKDGRSFTYSDLTEQQKLELKGDSGLKGNDGSSINITSVSSNALGNIIVNFSDNTSIEVPKGKDGTNGRDGVDGKNFTFNDLTDSQKAQLKGEKGDTGLTGDKGERGLQGIQGVKGNDGTSITLKSKTTNSSGNIVVTFSDNSTVEIPKGNDGIGGKDGKNLSFTDLTAAQKLEIKGDKGDKGDTGAAGKDGITYDTTNWQKAKLTQDNGQLQYVSLADNLDKMYTLTTGFYYTTTTPITGIGATSTAGFMEVYERDGGSLKRIIFRPYNSTQIWQKRFYNTWSDWEKVSIDINDYAIQKYKITNDDGTRIYINGLNPLTAPAGMYETSKMIDAPMNKDTGLFYVDITPSSNGRRLIEAKHSAENRTFIKTVHTNGLDTGWKELIDKGTLDKRTDFNGALVKLKENQPLSSNKYTMAIWGGAIYNTDGYWNPENPTRLTVPRGVTKVRISASILWENNDVGYRQLRVKQNNQYIHGLIYNRYLATTTAGNTTAGAVIDVKEGDYFELEASQTSGVTLNLREDPYTWMSIEAVEMSKEPNNSSFMLIGHRGATGYVPEHSMRGYHMAIDKGADYIELDLQLTKDNKLLCMHDATLDRTTTGSGSIRDKTLSEIQNSYTLKEGDKIPSLEDVLKEFGSSVKYYIETKQPFDMNMDKELLNQLKKYNLIGFGSQKFGVIIQSFAKESLINIKNQYSNIPLVYLSSTFTESYIQEAVDNGFYAVAPKYTTITKPLVDSAHNNGLKVHAWTVNNTAEMRDMESKGVDGIFTNYLDNFFA